MVAVVDDAVVSNRGGVAECKHARSLHLFCDKGMHACVIGGAQCQHKQQQQTGVGQNNSSSSSSSAYTSA